MGQILSWIRGPRDGPAVQDVVVEQQSQPKPTTCPVGPASAKKPAEFEKAATSPTAAAAKPTAKTAAAGAATAASAAVKEEKPGAATAPKESPKPAKAPASPTKAKAPASPTKAKPVKAATGAAVQATGPKESSKEPPKTPPIASSKGEAAKTESAKPAVGAGDAAKPAHDLGKPQKVKPKELPKSSPISPTKGKPVKGEPAAAAGAAGAAEAAAIKGKRAEGSPKETAKSSPISPTKGKPVRGEPAAAAAGGAAGAAEAAAIKGKPVEGSPKEAAKTKPSSPSKVVPAVPAGKTEGVKSKETPKPKPSSPSKVEPPKPVTGAVDVLKGKPKPGKPQEESKIQVEVLPIPVVKSADTPVVDPFDALADSLPSEARVPTAPVYTGPEVKEHDVTREEGILCGEDESSLPPEYRYEDMGKNVPAGIPEAKPTKPLSTDEALDSLSFGFVSSPPPAAPKKEPKVEDLSAIDALSSGFSNFAPPPPSTQKEIDKEKETNKGYLKRVRGAMVDSEEKAEGKVPASASSAGPLKSAAPPADKKAKLEKGCEEFSLQATVDKLPVGKKPVTDEGQFMSLDALGALGDLLPDAEPTPEPPKVRPEDMVKVDKLKEKAGVRVGEREDSLPPEYRFKEEDLKNLPPPVIEPSLDAGEVLDFLSGGFDAPAVAPKVQAPLPPSSKAPKSPKADDFDLAALDSLAGDFVPAPAKASAVHAPVPPPAKPPKKKAPPTVASGPVPSAPSATTDEGQFMSLDALSALGDLLPDAEPVPEPPKIRPEDMVKVDKLKEEAAVRVGEREDSLPPEYRFKEEDLKNLPPPIIEPSVDAGEVLDFLSGGFDAPAVAPTLQAPLPPSSKAPKLPSKGAVDPVSPPSVKVISCYGPPGIDFGKKPDSDFSLDSLVDNVVAPTTASAVQGAPHLSDTSDALDALSDTLMDMAPVAEPAPVPAKDIVKEKKVVKEKVVRTGDRDDTLPPEFRLTEEERKEMEKAAKAKAKADVRPKKKSIDDDAVLDLLSGDFSAPAVSAAPAASAAPKPQSAASPAETMPSQKGHVLDALSSTLLPDTPEFVPRQSPVGDKPQKSPLEEKPKAKSGKSKSRSKKMAVADTSALDELSGQLGPDVTSTSLAKKSSKS